MTAVAEMLLWLAQTEWADPDRARLIALPAPRKRLDQSRTRVARP